MSSSKSFEDWSEDMEIEAKLLQADEKRHSFQQQKVFKKFLARNDGTQE